MGVAAGSTVAAGAARRGRSIVRRMQTLVLALIVVYAIFFVLDSCHRCSARAMIVGHYAAALVPYSRLEGRPLWLLLVCANVPEFLWLALALAGVEPTKPASLLDATFPNIDVHMTYSHNLIPGIDPGPDRVCGGPPDLARSAAGALVWRTDGRARAL